MIDDIDDPFSSPDNKLPVNEHWEAKRKVADATRRLISRLVTCTSSVEELNQVAEQVNRQADILEKSPALYGRFAFEQATDNHYGNIFSLGYELNPLDGRSNPVAAPITVWIEDDRVHGRANMGWQYEGPPNSVHGGFISALFDQLLGIGQRISGQLGFTGTLTVKYLKPTPINTDLQLMGRIDRIEGRKKFMTAQMWAGDEVTATCEAVFISVTRKMYRDITDGAE